MGSIFLGTWRCTGWLSTEWPNDHSESIWEWLWSMVCVNFRCRFISIASIDLSIIIKSECHSTLLCSLSPLRSVSQNPPFLRAMAPWLFQALRLPENTSQPIVRVNRYWLGNGYPCDRRLGCHPIYGTPNFQPSGSYFTTVFFYRFNNFASVLWFSNFEIVQLESS